MVLRPLNAMLAQGPTAATRVIDGGDVVVVQAKWNNVAPDSRRCVNDCVFVIQWTGGRIVRKEADCDTALIAEILCARPVAKSI